MRLLFDQNLSADVAAALRGRGLDVVHTREVGLATADDDLILEWCRTEQRLAVTRDADFHALLALSGQTSPSVIRIRIEPLPDSDLIKIIEWILREKSEELTRGAAITVKATSIRVRDLPLRPIVGEGDL